MKLDFLKQRIVTCCCALFTIFWNSSESADVQRSDYDSTHVRIWSGWYNTDTPRDNGLDDESVTSIRKRGYEVCDGNSPIDAICRDARKQGNLFNSETLHYLDQILAIPCNTEGLLCRKEDQINRTCGDYEIKFECLSAKKIPTPENLGVIGVAAGLSVIVPILCVAIMHLIRLMKERRNGVRQSLMENPEVSVQTEASDLPPSYSILFGVSDENAAPVTSSSNQSSTTVSLTDSSGNIQLPSTRLSSNNLQSVTDSQTSSSSQPQGEVHSQTSQLPSDIQVRSAWRSRFPNMHLSIFDIFNSQGQSSATPSPDLSYIQTPPPTYGDAIIILGGQVYNVNENGEVGEKV